jgi:hypothetical protein
MKNKLLISQDNSPEVRLKENSLNPLLKRNSQNLPMSMQLDSQKFKLNANSQNYKKQMTFGLNQNVSHEPSVDNQVVVKGYDYREFLNNILKEQPDFKLDLTPVEANMPYNEKLRMLREKNKFLFEVTDEEKKLREKMYALGKDLEKVSV